MVQVGNGRKVLGDFMLRKCLVAGLAVTMVAGGSIVTSGCCTENCVNAVRDGGNVGKGILKKGAPFGAGGAVVGGTACHLSSKCP